MTQTEKLSLLKEMTDETKDAVLLAYLSLAGRAVINRAFPFDQSQQTVPERYEMNQIQIAVYLLNKRGAEGETAHSENGISRSYESADIPESMMSGIIPFAGVLK